MIGIPSFLKSLVVKEPQKCIFIGLDASGKTSLLYNLKLGEIVTTIPTIGFNVEEITVKENKKLTCWDLGGGCLMRSLFKHYYHDEMGILFFINGNDQERFEEALDMLVDQVGYALQYGQLLFLGIWIGKQDLPAVTPEIVKSMENKIRETLKTKLSITVPWRIYSQPGLSSLNKRYHEEIFEDIIDNLKARAKSPEKKRLPDTSSDHVVKSEIVPTGTKRITVEEIKEELERGKYHMSAVPGYCFFDHVKEGKLNKWTQYIKIRAMFLTLLKCMAEPSAFSTPQGIIFLCVGRYAQFLRQLRHQNIGSIDQSELIPHKTLDIFWIYQVYLTLLDDAKDDNMDPSKRGYFAQDMYYYYGKYPHLLDPLLWTDYYSPNIITKQPSNIHWFLPDIQSLPSMPTPSGTEPAPSIPGTSFSSAEFLEARSTDRTKRWAYATLQRVKMTGERRGKVVKEALEQFKIETMRARLKDQSIDPFSETQSYFWIQMIHSAIEHLERQDPDFDMTKMGYSTFELLFPEALGRSDVWKEYYTEDRWKSIESRMTFKQPNRGKSVPNVFIVDKSKKKKEQEEASKWKQYLVPQPPSFEELNGRMKTIMFEVEKLQKKAEYEGNEASVTAVVEAMKTVEFQQDDEDEVSSTGIKTPESEAEDDIWEDLGEKPSNEKSTSENDKSTTQASYDIPSTAPKPDCCNLEKVLTQKLQKIKLGNVPSQLEQYPDSDLLSLPKPTIAHSELLLIIFSHFQNPLQGCTSYDPQKPDLLTPQDISPITEQILVQHKHHVPLNTLVFWTRRVLEGIYEMSGAFRQPDYTLAQFLEKNPELAWEDLWLLYYSELSWWSWDARDGLLRADRRSVRGYLKSLED